MSRAAFQVLVIPYRIEASGQPRYLVFKRADQNYWQWIAGGGENQESPDQTARREVCEEAGVSEIACLIRLDSVASIPVIHFANHQLWGNKVYVIPEYSFAIQFTDEEICLSVEHDESAWLDYKAAYSCLKWDSNKTALWELHRRLLLEKS